MRLHRVFQNLMNHSSSSAVQNQNRLRVFMEEHGEVNKILDRGNVWNRGGDGWDPIGEEGELFTSFCNRDISINRVFIINDIQSFHWERMEDW